MMGQNYLPFLFLLVCFVLFDVSYCLVCPSRFSYQHQPFTTTKTKSSTTRTSSTSSLCMISFGGTGAKKKQDEEQLPRDVKDAVSKCRAAVQEALQARLSRMDIEFPVGAKFGVEKSPKKGNKRKGSSLAQSDSDAGAPTKDVLDTSDRELARIFVDMFQPLGGSHISAIFKDVELADIAKQKWKGDSTASCNILSLDRRKKKKKKLDKKKKKPMGFAQKLNEEFASDSDDVNDGSSSVGGPFQLPKGTEVAIFVSPGPKELVIVEKICKEVGMDTCVILLNARLDNMKMNWGTDETTKLFKDDFQSVFALRAMKEQDLLPSCLIHRSYPNKWILARKPKVGPPKTILVQQNKPSLDECVEAYNNLEIPEIEKNVEGVLENVAGWFN